MKENPKLYFPLKHGKMVFVEKEKISSIISLFRKSFLSDILTFLIEHMFETWPKSRIKETFVCELTFYFRKTFLFFIKKKINK